MTQFRITIDNTGETFKCGAEMNVLEAIEAALCKGIPVGCRNGGCDACKVRVTQGRYTKRKMNRAVLSDEEEADCCVLACKAYPQSDLSVTALGRRWGAPRNTEAGRSVLSSRRPRG